MVGVFFRFERFLTRWTMRPAMALLVLCCLVSLYQVVTRFVVELTMPACLMIVTDMPTVSLFFRDLLYSAGP